MKNKTTIIEPDEPHLTRRFDPHTYQCKKCSGCFSSSYPGEFVSCPCGDCAVDETLWYIRHIGGEREEVKNDGSSVITTDNI